MSIEEEEEQTKLNIEVKMNITLQIHKGSKKEYADVKKEFDDALYSYFEDYERLSEVNGNDETIHIVVNDISYTQLPR